ncbi:hypothetical protein SDRG_14900 [Saprolegnia diclina VS20]|uniref:Uncharacterized protein n=1 Tax=Saprolegnia diclina (strain VS20) TaxID=1156394 RepID=T0PPA9_SAPDV|nr:hypothetical protein SDRG_14900 [Saprolegnia diclina VS20]EQC27279.1 hypothetical protein SDRG_14900 [Saprolegnia diclina VS20]|eukprot:XP_008619282.1 hypothetical protein SDRG_14900 [Saprolegnia diclina VS20]
MDISAASKFGQKLAHTEKNVRDKAVKSLTLFLVSKKEWSDLDLDKIWKALFYCMWMSDKMKIQQELADNLSKLVHAFPSDALKLRFVHSFFKTIQREWHGIDGLRLDKFYTLVRMMLFQSFKFLEATEFALNEAFASHLESAILSQLPNGLRLHVSDVYLSELFKAVGDSIPADAFVQLLAPFFTLMSTDADKAVAKRVHDLILTPLVSEYFFLDTQHTKPAPTDAETTDDEAEAPKQFAAAALAEVQHRIFEIAAAEETLDRNRNLLYTIYATMYAKTKVDSSKPDAIAKARQDMAKKAAKNTAPAKKVAEAKKVAAKKAAKEEPKKVVMDKKAEKESPKKVVVEETKATKKAAKEEPKKVTKEVEKVEKTKKTKDEVVETKKVKAVEAETKKAKKAAKEEPVVVEPKKAAKKAPVVEEKPAKKAKKDEPASKKKEKTTPYPRCASCGGFGKGLVPTGKTMCGHCERSSKATKKEAKSLKRKAAPVVEEAAEDSEDTKRVTFGKSKALPYELSMKRMKKSATKEVVKPATGKGVLKVKEIKAKHDMTSVKRNTTLNSKRMRAADFF